MSLNVLVVDDSAVVRSVIVKTLRLTVADLGEVYQACNGREGLESLDKNWVDIVFADINMPVMTGEEMIEEIRKNPLWEALPIVVVSTEGSQTRIERLQSKGVRFIHKPFAPEIVSKIIQEITGITNEQQA
jgi:two-component system chemotaxis response regulator CheY